MNNCKLTIGMPSYNNAAEVWATVQALKIYHDLKDMEILVIDNFGDPAIEKFAKNTGIRYEKFTEVRGVSAAKNKVFELARGEYVLCIDSHIMIDPDALKNLPEGDDFYQGPLRHASGRVYTCEWLPVFRACMWGVWGPNMTRDKIPKEPFDIWAMGAGFFLCRRDTWLGFNKRFLGFGGESGYLQTKYRQSGRKVLCQPSLIWTHMFNRNLQYPIKMVERVRNYLLGFDELHLDTKLISDNFDAKLVAEAKVLIASGN